MVLHKSLSLFVLLCSLVFFFFAIANADANETSILEVDGSTGRKIPDTFFGVFFEEINHAGEGGLWGELVRNRGFESGGPNVPSNIAPWTVIGDESTILLTTDRSSLFERNKIALRMEVFCDGPQSCPPGGVGVYNPGFWGMNIEKGKKYRVIFYVRAIGPIDLKVALAGSDDGVELASTNFKASGFEVSSWRRMETILEGQDTNHNSSLRITTTNRGIVWLDQVSVMPLDTYKGHGFRTDLLQMVKKLKPKFFRFPGGCYVQGNYLRNAFRWKDTVGPWEERPGHFDDVWHYWTDDGFGFYEGLQFAEDVGALPVWVFSDGISLHDEVNTSDIQPFVQEALDGIEFARGPTTTTWGALRALMGHPEPFDLRFVAVGNENCGKPNYLGNYLKFYAAVKHAYPDMQIITNCDGSKGSLPMPADLYDFHIYKDAGEMFSKYTKFDNAPRDGPKAFVSEYAVWQENAGKGTLLAAVAEAAFLMGLEKNSDLVTMVSYAPLFVNTNNRVWSPDAIVFDSYRHYGTPSYWLQRIFTESSGATYLNSTLQTSSKLIVASAIKFTSSEDQKNYLRIKAVNFGSEPRNLKISINGLSSNVQQSGSRQFVLTAPNVMEENSFNDPKRIVPQQSLLPNANKDMDVSLSPYSVTTFDLLI